MAAADPENPVDQEVTEKAGFTHQPRWLRALWAQLAVVLGVITVFWKICLTKQYTFLASPDLANMVVPRLQPTIYAIRHFSIFLWNPYELFGQPSIGQVQPGVTSPFTFLMALPPLHNGHVSFFYINLWFVAIHCLAGLFAWRFFRELGCSEAPAAITAVLYATMGYNGTTGWPNNLQPAIMAPLVFLFLLRSLRGRAPLKNAAWAGVMLGISWLCGHHDPPVMMTIALVGIGLAAAAKRNTRREAVLRMAVLFAAMGLVAAVQILPALEYGKLSTRWTATGPKTWQDKVPFIEHEQQSVRPAEVIHTLISGGNNAYSDPFVGVVGLSLVAIAIWSGFRRREVRLFVVLAGGSLLYAMAGNDVLYGPLYALAPLIEKTREPIVALFLFGFAMASLAAIGAEIVFSGADEARDRKVVRTLVWLGAGIMVLIFLVVSLKPALPVTTIAEGDTRPAVSALIALLLAGIYQAWSKKSLSRNWAIALVGLLIVMEQGIEDNWAFAPVKDPARMAVLDPLENTQDLADFLARQPHLKRVEKNDREISFNFGDWYQIDSANAYGASMLTQTNLLGGWWTERIGRMYGLNYYLGKTPDRTGLQDVFTGKSGIKIWYDAGAFPRAWTVHKTILAPNEPNGYNMMNTGTFDLRTTALVLKTPPQLGTCDGADRVTAVEERQTSQLVKVEMACKGMLMISDNYYPGWYAELDGNSVEILRTNMAIRGVVVPAGKHTVTMNYRPFSTYFGMFATLLGLAGAIVLQRRPEKDGPDLM
jgi:hypothetical protein